MTASTLISGGTVLSVDPAIGDLPRGDVLIEDDVIRAVAPQIDAPDAQRIDATNRIVMPGLVDTHRHMWQAAVRQVAADWTIGEYVEHMLGGIGPKFTAEDVHVADLLSGLEALNNGITTIFDWSHIVNTPEHADAAVGGLTESGIRGVYGYGLPRTPAPSWYTADAARIRKTYFSSDNQRVTMALASLGPEFASMEEAEVDLRLARELDLRTSLHLGCGLLGGMRAVTGMHERGLLGPDLIFVHCNTCTDDELRLIAATGGHVSISPRVEMQMGHGYPATGRLIAAGVQPSLSVDVVSGVGGSLFAEMRGMLEAERGWQNHQALQRGEWTTRLELRTRDAVRIATLEGARTLGMEDRIGSLTPGKQADIIMLAVDRPNLALINDLPAAVTLADGENVDAVFVAGRLVKANGKLLSHDLRNMQDRICASRDRLLPDVATAV
jgi:5-methylthioadenosine/S-adenosylhomocysteine deaminase